MHILRKQQDYVDTQSLRQFKFKFNVILRNFSHLLTEMYKKDQNAGQTYIAIRQKAPLAVFSSPRMTKHKSKSASKESATAIFAPKIVFHFAGNLHVKEWFLLVWAYSYNFTVGKQLFAIVRLNIFLCHCFFSCFF